MIVHADERMERIVLGTIMVNEDSLLSAMEILDTHCFYHAKNSAIYNAIVQIAEMNLVPDIVSVNEQLIKNKHDIIAGGELYLMELTETATSPRNIEKFCNRLKDLKGLRQITGLNDWLNNACNVKKVELQEVLEPLEKKLSDISNVIEPEKWVLPKDILPEIVEDMDKASTGEVSGLSTGFKALDKITTGLHPSDLIILAGRPSMGKTAVALNIAMNVAKKYPNKTIAFFSMEMSRKSIVQRMICAEAEIEMSRLRSSNMTQKERTRCFAGFNTIQPMNIEIDDTGLLTPLQQRTKLRKLKRQGKDVCLIICDYLQLMRDSEKHQNRQSEITSISRNLKGIAKEFEVPYIALSQLSRACEMRGANKRPMLSDLRESGAIEQDADIVAFTYRDEMYNKETEDKGVAEIIIGKQRNGATGTVKLSFEGSFMKFYDLYSNNNNEEPEQNDWFD